MFNHYYRVSLHTVNEHVIKGGKLSDNLEIYSSLYPPTVTRMIAVGETSGNMSETLMYLADFYESEVDTAAKTLSTAIEPILLIGVGIMVGFLALSIITPIYDITGNIHG
jgi:type II secretory pathway component PulF